MTDPDPAGEQPCRLYLITPPVFDPATFAPVLAGALDGGEVAVVQVRLKGADDGQWRAALRHLVPLVQGRDITLIVNDRADLAAEFGADGVHLGQGDMPLGEARRLVGPDAVIGISAEASRDLAMRAGEAGADYVAFGPIHPTTSKEVGDRIAPLDLLTWWQEIAVLPAVAIGGLTPQNCAESVRAGADFIAAMGAVWNHPDGPGAAVAAFNRAMAAA